MAKKSKKIWFTQVRGSYLPSAWQGWVLYVPFIAFLLVTAIEANRSGRTYAGMAYFLLPQYVSSLVVMHWIASRFSE